MILHLHRQDGCIGENGCGFLVHSEFIQPLAEMEWQTPLWFCRDILQGEAWHGTPVRRRLGVSRLDGEHHGHAPRTRPGQPKQEGPQQRRDIQVQQHRDDVKAGRGESPQSMLQPEQCGQHWPVRGLIAVNGAGLKPDLPRARQALGRLGSHQQGVVPHEAPRVAG